MQDFEQKLAKYFVYFYLNREINEIYRKNRPLPILHDMRFIMYNR